MAEGPNERLFPPELLFKKRPACTARSAQVPFRPPGPSAAIPPRPADPAPVQYLRAVRLRGGLNKLVEPLREIEADSAFVKSAMDAALLVPRAIQRTFERVHGKLYDVQTAISLGDDEQKRAAFRIQLAIRAFLARRKLKAIQAAMRRSIARDGMPLRTMLLSLTLSYAKRDEAFRLKVNRRFINRAREGVRFWQHWATEEAQRWVSVDGQIQEMQGRWKNRYLGTIARRWVELAQGPHARKALKALANGIDAEAAERGVKRTKVLIDRGLAIGNAHRVKVFLQALRTFVQAAKLAGRRARLRARDFRISHVKRAFLRAWLALSIGRISIFGGWLRWSKPVNRRAIAFEQDQLAVQRWFCAWHRLCACKCGAARLRAASQQRWLCMLFTEFRGAATASKSESQRWAAAGAWGRRRQLRRIVRSWRGTVTRERELMVLQKFVMARNTRERVARARRRTFRRWLARFLAAQAARFEEVGQAVDGFTSMWLRAAREMEGSLQIFAILRQKVVLAVGERRRDAAEAVVRAAFLRDEQRALSLAVQNCRAEIEAVHELIAKSALRFFVPIKPVHDSVLDDIPRALREYVDRREAERSRAANLRRSVVTLPEPALAEPTGRSQGKPRKTTDA